MYNELGCVSCSVLPFCFSDRPPKIFLPRRFYPEGTSRFGRPQEGRRSDLGGGERGIHHDRIPLSSSVWDALLLIALRDCHLELCSGVAPSAEATEAPQNSAVGQGFGWSARFDRQHAGQHRAPEAAHCQEASAQRQGFPGPKVSGSLNQTEEEATAKAKASPRSGAS